MKVWIDPKLCKGGDCNCDKCFDKLLRHRPCITGYERDGCEELTVYAKVVRYEILRAPDRPTVMAN